MNGGKTTLLQVLAAADRVRRGPLGRTYIMKVAYLVGLLKPAYVVWLSGPQFVHYRYGPYAPSVSAQLDFLVFHGLATVEEYQLTAVGVRASYSITDDGRVAATQAADAQLLGALCDDVLGALGSLGILTAKQICALVYAEPAFASELARGLARPMDATHARVLPDSNSADHPSFRGYAVVREAAAKCSLTEPRDVTRAFFVALYRRALAGREGVSHGV